MIKNVYFIENIAGVQYFLSIHEPAPTNLIVMGSYPSLQRFLKELLPTEKNITLSRISENYLASGKFKRLKDFYKAKLRARNLFKNVSSNAKAWFFSSVADEHLFIPLSTLHSKGCEIIYVPAAESFYPTEIIPNKNFSDFLYRKVLGFVSGTEFLHTKATIENWTGLGMPLIYDTFEPELLSWDQISKKFSFADQKESENTILIVDGPIQHYDGINTQKTLSNLRKWIELLLDKGIQIHLKPHHGATFHSFSGTGLEPKLKILEKHFPVELILNRYPEVYFFSSASCMTSIEGKKFSLAKLMEFDAQEKKELFFKRHDFQFLSSSGFEYV